MNTNVAMKTGFIMASVWFATHCGGGFATGNQEVNYFVKYGWYSLILPIFSMFLVGWAHRNALVIAKDYKTYNYRSYSDALFHPYEKYFSFVFELGYILLFTFAVSSSIAGSGSLLQNAIGLPYYIGIVLIGSLLIVLTIAGGEAVIKALSFKSYFLIITLSLVCIMGIYTGMDNLTKIVSERMTFNHSFSEALWDSVIYVGFQTFTVMPIISLAQNIKSTKACNWFMFFGTALNGIFLLLVCIMLLAFAPDTLGTTLPVYFVGEKLQINWLQTLYSVILLVALFGTGVSLVFSAVARFEPVLTAKNILGSVKIRRAAVSVIILIICTGISSFGLTNIVVKGYGMLGYVGIIFVLIPQLVVGTIKIRKNARLRKEQGIEEE